MLSIEYTKGATPTRICLLDSANMDSELSSMLNTILNFSVDMLKLNYEMSIPSELAPPTSFWKSYTNEKLAIRLRACLALWAASQKKIVPKEFHIEVIPVRTPVLLLFYFSLSSLYLSLSITPYPLWLQTFLL